MLKVICCVIRQDTPRLAGEANLVIFSPNTTLIFCIIWIPTSPIHSNTLLVKISQGYSQNFPGNVVSQARIQNINCIKTKLFSAKRLGAELLSSRPVS